MNPPPAHGLAPRVLAGPALRMQSDGRLVTLVRDGQGGQHHGPPPAGDPGTVPPAS